MTQYVCSGQDFIGTFVGGFFFGLIVVCMIATVFYLMKD